MLSKELVNDLKEYLKTTEKGKDWIERIERETRPFGNEKNVNYVKFFETIENLKTTKRTGWIRKGVPNPESISDHMYRMAIMSLLVPDSAIDLNRCCQMSLMHDIGESIVGDITPHDPVSKEEKFKREKVRHYYRYNIRML
jgi:hypothetical protein